MSDAVKNEVKYYAHDTAIVDEEVSIGDGTKIWHFAHVCSGVEIGTNCVIGQNVYIGPGVKIGNNVKIQNNVSVYEGITIEDEVFLGPSCVLTNDKTPSASGDWDLTETYIRKGASVGANATIVCGVTLGENSLVGAGAVVTKDVEPDTVVVGNPATILKAKKSVGVIGCGTVGGAIVAALKNSKFSTVLCDKYKDGDEYKTIEELKDCNLVFISVPTPFDEELGKVNLEPVISSAISLHDSGFMGTLIVKSTVPPGTTRHIQNRCPKMKVLFNPEFLRENTAVQDFYNQKNIVFGVPEAWSQKDQELVDEVFGSIVNNFVDAKVEVTTYETAEMIKYSQNVMYAVRVATCNIIYDACEDLDVDYDKVKEIAFYNEPTIGRSVVEVPGPDGKRGFGGKCLITGTKVLTPSGLKNNEELVVNDLVFDGSSYTKVTQVGRRSVDSVTKILSRGRELVGSHDHIQIICDLKGNKKEVLLSEVKKADWIFVPQQELPKYNKVTIGERPKRSGLTYWRDEVIIDSGLSRLFGLYAAEGCSGKYTYKRKTGGTKNEYTTIWSFGEGEEHLAEEVKDILDNKLGIKCQKKLVLCKDATYGPSTTWQVRVRNMWLHTLIKSLNLGNNSHEKNMIILSQENAKSFIGGWLDGDGTLDKNTNAVSGFSRSKDLIKKVDLMLNGLGICSFISKDGQQINVAMRNDVAKVISWTKHEKFKKPIVYKRETVNGSPNLKKIEDGWISKVKSIEKISGDFELVSLETESQLYVANGILTHNCLPKDLAGFNGFHQHDAFDAILKYNKELGRIIE